MLVFGKKVGVFLPHIHPQKGPTCLIGKNLVNLQNAIHKVQLFVDEILLGGGVQPGKVPGHGPPGRRLRAVFSGAGAGVEQKQVGGSQHRQTQRKDTLPPDLTQLGKQQSHLPSSSPNTAKYTASRFCPGAWASIRIFTGA